MLRCTQKAICDDPGGAIEKGIELLGKGEEVLGKGRDILGDGSKVIEKGEEAIDAAGGILEGVLGGRGILGSGKVPEKLPEETDE